MNQFTERYKAKSDSELLRIVYKPEDFQPLAVEAAKIELSNRQLTIEEINQAKTYYELQQKEKENLIAKQIDFENKIRNIGYTLIETFNPVPKSEFTSEKLIRLITLVFSGISIYQFYRGFRSIRVVFTPEDIDWVNAGFTYVPLLLAPIVTFLFWNRKGIGWILLAIFLTYCVIMVIEFLIMAIYMQLSSLGGINSVSPTMDPTRYIMSLVFYMATLYLSCKDKIRDIYRINRREMIITIGSTTAIVGLLTFVIYFL